MDDAALMHARLKLIDSVRIVLCGVLQMLKNTAPHNMKTTVFERMIR